MRAIRTRGSSARGRVQVVRKVAVVCAAIGLIAAIPGAFESAGAVAGPPSPPFTECPAVGYNTSCTLLIDVIDGGRLILKDTGATLSSDPVKGTYDGIEDTLIGVINNSSTSLSSMVLSSNSQRIFGFDNDGICQDRNSTSGLAGLHCGTVRTGTSPYFNWNNPNDPTGYGGPNAFFNHISSDFKTGTVNFATAIPPGGTGYFSLEEPLDIPDFCQDTITLSPASVTSVVGGPSQTFTATILDLGSPAAGIAVTFSVSSGPHSGLSSVVNTDTNGQAQFTVPTSTTAGTDTVQASYHDPTCTSPPTHSAVPSTLTWTKASPSITTQATPTGITVGTATTVGDTATFGNLGPIAPTGSVTFSLYSNNACTGTPVLSGAGAISSSTASFSTGWTAPAAGTYYWRASYAGNAANNGFTTGCGDANEVVAVAKDAPTITTQAAPISIPVGTATTVGDTATFLNTTSVAPTGSVTFTLYGDNACTMSTGVSGNGAIHTSGGVSTASFATSWTAPTAGTFYWRASYPGDANNDPYTTGCGGANELIGVGPASPTITTVASPTSVTVGTATTVGDGATFQNTSLVAPTGPVTFTLYSDSACSTPAGVSGDGAISTSSGVSTASFSTGWVAPQTGTYYWTASYAGDGANNGYTTACGAAGELLVVNPGSPTITTQATPTMITVGTPMTVGDTATFEHTTQVSPTGNVTFTLYSDSACTSSTGVSGPATISTTANISTASFSTGWSAPAAGTYFWRASYPGDSNNNGFTTGCGDANELIVVGPGSPTMTTQASPASMAQGTTLVVGDTATFHNTTQVVPTGSVMFTLYSDNLCATSTGVSGPGIIVTASGVSSATFSTSWTAPATGTYYWQASYGGDLNNTGFTTGCGDPNEQLGVSGPGNPQTSTSVTTSLSGASHSGAQITVPAGTPVTDGTTLSGQHASTATGTISYSVYSDATCQTPVTSGGVLLVNNGSVPRSGPVTLNAGTYYWKAVYSGDGFNHPAGSPCGAEVETVTAAGSGSGQVLDHFVCYTATSPATAAGGGFRVPASVRLTNQFSPNGFAPKIGAVALDCNPARKAVPKGVTPVSNPNAHLLCWNVSAAAASKTVIVSNQFGSANLKTGATSQLCLPSWMTAKAPRTGTPVAPPGLSHFTCYAVAYTPGAIPFRPPAPVFVRDQFSSKGVQVKVGAPRILCLPTTKVANGVTYKALNPQAHLLCYSVSRTPTINPVYDQNQFGGGRVVIRKTALLCLPSTKVVVGPSG